MRQLIGHPDIDFARANESIGPFVQVFRLLRFPFLPRVRFSRSRITLRSREIIFLRSPSRELKGGGNNGDTEIYTDQLRLLPPLPEHRATVILFHCYLLHRYSFTSSLADSNRTPCEFPVVFVAVFVAFPYHKPYRSFLRVIVQNYSRNNVDGLSAVNPVIHVRCSSSLVL